MKLAPGERSILAYFVADTDAQAAKAALAGVGFQELQVDRVSRFGSNPGADRKRPAISGKESSEVNAVLEPAQLDDDSRVLLAAFPENSGMSAPNTNDHASFLLTVVTREERVEEAVGILKQHGAKV